MDLKNTIKIDSTLPAAVYNTNTSGVGVDRQGFFETAIVVFVGVITDGIHTVTIEESDDNATFTAMAAGDLDGALTNLVSNTNQEIGYFGNKRYVRAVTSASGATGGAYAVTVINAQPRRSPK